MKYLFVHQNFPGQFLHLLNRLIAQNTHEIVFITEANANQMAGVRKLVYRLEGGPPTCHRDAQEFELGIRRAEAVARMAQSLAQLGFTPDIIIGHEGWGEMLNLPDIWPDIPRLGYQEFYYNLQGADVGFDPEFPVDPNDFSRIRAKNALNLLTLTNGSHGQTPTQFQLSTYPDWAGRQITLLPEGVDLQRCAPDREARRRVFQLGPLTLSPSHKLLTYVARDLEPYRGFHTAMRALPRLLAERPDLHVVMVGGDGTSYGARLHNDCWRAVMLRELAGKLDLTRVHFPGKLDYADYLRLLQRSDAHLYLTYPFVASWSLREALACGCAVVASDTAPVTEFVRDGETGLLTPCLNPDAVAERVLELLENTRLNNKLRRNARRYAQAELCMETYLDHYQTLIHDLIERRV